MGIIALLLAILATPLQYAHKQALSTRCAAQLQQIGVALESNLAETNGFYPLWDDASQPVRFTWIDLLVQQGHLGNVNVAYCPDDPAPSVLNAARGRQLNLFYPRGSGGYNTHGIDYSYGISVPLAVGAGRGGMSDSAGRATSFDRNTAQRVMVTDANWSAIFNLSGAVASPDWSFPTHYDNTVEYRHPKHAANYLMQDGHAERVAYSLNAPTPINTARHFVWYQGEDLNVSPELVYDGMRYPMVPQEVLSASNLGSYPAEAVPAYFTRNHLWTEITHK